MSYKKIVYLLVSFFIFGNASIFSQDIIDNTKPRKQFSIISQQKKNDRLWELCSKTEPTSSDIAELNILINSGADVNYIKNNKSWNLLYQTIYRQKGFFAEILCKAGCDVNYIYKEYATNYKTSEKYVYKENCLVYFALDHKIDFSIIKTIIESGSSLNFVDIKNEKNILTIALYREYKKDDILYLLEKGATVQIKLPPNQKICPVQQPVIDAVKTGDIDFVKEFIKHGARLDVYSKSGCGCCLNAAAISGNIKMVQFCLDNGCNFYDIPDTMWSPLDYALINENEELVKFFKEKGLNINHINKAVGNTIIGQELYWADENFSYDYNYRKADLSSCFFALKMGIDPLIKDCYKNTLISQAINKAKEYPFNCDPYISFAKQAIEIAKTNGYSPDIRELIIINDTENLKKVIQTYKVNDNEDLFYYATTANSNDCLQILFDAGLYPKKDAIIQNIKSGDLKTLEFYYKNNVDFNSFDNNSMSIFTSIVIHNDDIKKCISYILSHGYDINKNVLDYNKTPLPNLCYFAKSTYYDMMEILIQNGADVNISYGKEQNTPLMESLSSSKCTELLLENGADPFAKDIDGNTIFDMDYYNNSRRVIQKYFIKYYENKTYAATDNLNIREYDSPSANLIDTIKKGTKVKITNVGRYYTIDGIKSFFVKIEYSNAKGKNEGWCFAGYLEQIQ